MDPLVAHVAVAEIPVPVPVVVNVVAAEGPVGRRPEPEVVVERRRERARPASGRWPGASGRRGRAPCTPCRSSPSAGAGRPPGWPPSCGAARRAGRCAGTCRAASTSLPPLPDVVGGRLLDVDVLARLAGPDRRQGVPVVGCRHGDDVDLLVLVHAPEVLLGLDGPGVLLLELRRALAEKIPVGVAQRRHLDAGELHEILDVALPATVDAEHGGADAVVRTEGRPRHEGWRGGKGGRPGRALDEVPARHVRLLVHGGLLALARNHYRSPALRVSHP